MFCEPRWREKELERKRTSEDKGTGGQAPVTSVCILRCGWWRSGSHRFSNMAPKACGASLWQIWLQGDRTSGSVSGREAPSLPSGCPQSCSGNVLRVWIQSFSSLPSKPLPVGGSLTVLINGSLLNRVPHQTHTLPFYTIGIWHKCSLVDSCVLSPTDLSVS